MAVYNEGATFSILAGEALPAYRLVKIGESGGLVKATLADAGDVPWGMTGVAATLNGAYADVTLLTAGRVIGVASEAITIGEDVKVANDGKLQDATSGEAGVIGIAMEAAAGNGDEIAVLINPLLFIGESGS
jgi:hypothetical protein